MPKKQYLAQLADEKKAAEAASVASAAASSAAAPDRAPSRAHVVGAVPVLNVVPILVAHPRNPHVQPKRTQRRR